MAQKIQISFIDDLDGSEAEGAVRFGLDGSQYEIDLNTAHAKDLRKTLAPYTEAARKVTGAVWRSARNDRRTSANRISTREVREWARAQGIEVKTRGRVPAELVAKFQVFTSK
jgi:hypothetical protein